MSTKNSRLLLGLLLLLFTASIGFAQSKSELEDIAYDHLNNFEFVKAYEAFDKLVSRYPKEVDYKFKLGICALGYPEKKLRAIDIFKEIAAKNNNRESNFYLAKAYHVNYKFDEAMAVLKPLMDAVATSKKKDDKDFLNDATIIMNNCQNGKLMVQNAFSTAKVQNIGSPINTKEIEAVPIITADESMMIFTYQGRKSMGGKLNAALESDQNGSYLTDIYMSLRNSDSTWKTPTPITALNTKANDAAIALSPDGMTLFTFLSNNENEGDIFVSKFNGTEFGKPEPLNENINSKEYWEGSCSISADGKTLYFSSERPTGGLGGRDIWVSHMENGDWGPATNLGPKINTPYNDDAPFMHHDGVTLFFSSQGHSSIGGYDIFFSTKEGNEWTEPKNMGLPLNTTEDDRFYVINSKGDKGYFSSDRASSDSKGSQDIYMVNPGSMAEKLIVALFKGIVYGDNKPIEAKIEIAKVGEDDKLGPYHSNGASGKYLIMLKPGYVYKLKISADGFDPLEEEIDLETLNGYLERTKDYNIYSKPFIAAKPNEVVAQTEKVYKPSDDEITFFNPKRAPKTETLAVTPTPTTETVVKEETKVEPAKPTETVAVAVKEEPKKTNPKKGEPKKTEPVAVVVKEEPKKIEPKKTEPVAVAVKEEPKKIESKTEPIVVKEEPKKTEPIAVVVKEETKEAEPKTEPKKTEPLAVAVKEETKKEEPVIRTPKVIGCNNQLADLSSIKGKSLNDPAVYKQMLALVGNFCETGVEFKVQIGAYRKPENYKYKNLKNLGRVDTQEFPDGITRFTQNQFKTVKEADAHRQKAIAKGQKDSWIVVYAKGVRFTLEEFINIDFQSKAVN